MSQIFFCFWMFMIAETLLLYLLIFRAFFFFLSLCKKVSFLAECQHIYRLQAEHLAPLYADKRGLMK